MTPKETLMLVRYVKACCPQQAIDEFTPDAWHDLLGDLAFGDCRKGAAAVARRQPFVAPSEIRKEVREARDHRVDDAEIPPPPRELVDNPAAYTAALRAAEAAAADGADPQQAMAMVARRAQRELEA